MATSDSPLSVPNVTLAVARGAQAIADIPAFYVPDTLKFISWDAPVLAHTGVDIDYKMTAYDWYDRTLAWSVTGPTGMTIDPDGTLHWTPDTDLTTHSVTVECSLGGQETLSKTFTCSVDNSRCFFVATGGSDSAAGTLAAPFLTFERAAIAAKGASSARTIYSRSGTYDVSWNWEGNANFSDVYTKTWAADGPLLLRNYPGEEVKYQTIDGHGFRMAGAYSIVYGMWFSGATTPNTAGCVVAKNAVAKRVRVSDSDWYYNSNCTGIQHRAGSLLDQCQAWDNYDRNAPAQHNNSNYLYYGTGDASLGRGYIIDCLSDGLSARQSQCGFKIKHAGVNPPVYHKTAMLGDPETFAGINKQMVVRHCVVYGSLNAARTDEQTAGVNSTDEGFLVQNNILFNPNGSTFSFEHYLQFMFAANLPMYVDNEVIGLGTGIGNIFAYGYASLDAAQPGWDLIFSRNKIYTASPANAVFFKGDGYPLSTLTDKGVDNIILTAAPDYTFSAAGRDFQIVNGVCSEVIV